MGEIQLWPRLAVRWMILIGSLWSLLALARCVLHQSSILPGGIDPTTTAIINLGCGVYYGAWLVLIQKLVFSAEGVLERLFWGSAAVAGLWVLSPDSQELLGTAVTKFGMFAASNGAADGLKYVSIWWMALGAVASLWIAQPLFRGFLVGPTSRNGTTVPLLRETAQSRGVRWILGFIRIIVLVGFTFWLKSNMDLQEQPGKALSYWVFLLLLTSLGLTSVSYYLAITMRRRRLGLLFFHAIWLGAPGLLIGLIYVFQISWAIRPNQVVDALVYTFAPFLVGFSFSLLVSFWSSVWFRDRAILVMPAAIIAQRRAITPTDVQESDSKETGVIRYRWSQILVSVGMAIALFAAIQWSGLFLQQQVHLGTWWTTDKDHWNRATSLARLQQLQDTDLDIAKTFNPRYWQYNRALSTTRDGLVRCVVSAKMASDPAWKSLRRDIELNFRDVVWVMDFPVSDLADICGSANAVLKIDGEKLRLRDLPAVMYPMPWEIYGGTIEDLDYARGAGTHSIVFKRCSFTDVDFQSPLNIRRQTLDFIHCEFANFPKIFPNGVCLNFTLSRPEEFEENHQLLIEALFNFGLISLEPSNPSTFDGDHLLAQIPKPWRRLIRISRYGNGQIMVEREPILSLYTSLDELPANFNTPIMATNESGRITGLDSRERLWSRTELAQLNDKLGDDSRLSWFQTWIGTGHEESEVALLTAMVGHSWLLKIEHRIRSNVALWSNKLATHNFVDSGKALYISDQGSSLNLDLLSVFTNRDILIVDCQPWPPGFTAGLAKVPQLKRIVVLIAGDTPNATEAADIQLLQVVPGLPVEVLRRPNTTEDLVRLLKEPESPVKNP
ncbi:MAG: hypothetical protein Q8M16_05000 [Pirellulaceae bacterium]|nr:hypothetical protein [Pirellulaceae bacterium]